MTRTEPVRGIDLRRETRRGDGREIAWRWAASGPGRPGDRRHALCLFARGIRRSIESEDECAILALPWARGASS